MERWKKKKPKEYMVDLTKIDGDGSFPCPRCNAIISPDDDESHKITETVVKRDKLAELILECTHCGFTIRLVGFLSQPK